jgi:hypothetical protein
VEWIFEIWFGFRTVLTKNHGSVSLKHGSISYINFELLEKMNVFLVFSNHCMHETLLSRPY